jgi:AcrR family transcriptional regulator
MRDSPVGGATRWERRKELTHHRLLEVGERLFREQGFDATTVEEIAIASDVAKGTFFNYFPSKEALLGEILYVRTQSVLLSAPEDGLSAYERIWQLLEAVRSELAPFSNLFPRMFAYVLMNPPQDLAHGEHDGLGLAIARLVRAGQSAGEFRRDADADVAGALVATHFFRLCMMESVCEQQQGSSWSVQMQAVLNLLYRGLKCVVPEDQGCGG